MKTKFIFTDIHGCFDTMSRLIEKVASSNISEQHVIDNMVICGDLIDRGNKSKQVVQFCIDNNIEVVMGNHELLMLDEASKSAAFYNKRGFFNSSLWSDNGGNQTMGSYLLDSKVDTDTLATPSWVVKGSTLFH